jgi:hypothetical protein
MMRSRGDFGDPFGGEIVAASSPEFELDSFLKSFETLAKKAASMNKSQRYDLQKRLGSAVRDFQLELLRMIESQQNRDE